MIRIEGEGSGAGKGRRRLPCKRPFCHRPLLQPICLPNETLPRKKAAIRVLSLDFAVRPSVPDDPNDEGRPWTTTAGI